MQTVAFCEIDPLCQKVLRRHWPEVTIYDDIRQLTATKLVADGIAVEVICGGFPCQDISRAGKGLGLSGERSGLWFEIDRLVSEILPRYIILENAAELRRNGLDVVLGCLASRGYDAQWESLRASFFGLPHRRERTWIVANRNGERELQPGWGVSDKRGWCGNQGEAINWILSSGGILRSNDGIPARLDRIGMTGNAVIPQIPEAIGRAILAAQI